MLFEKQLYLFARHTIFMHTMLIVYEVSKDMSKLIAVETSDIVGSTKLSPKNLSAAISALRAFVSETQVDNGLVVEFYRGDAFQIMYPDPISSFKNLLLLKLYMLSHLGFAVKITQSLAIGNVSLPVSSLNDRMDDVFIASGRNLENINKGEIGIFAQSFTNSDYLSLAFLNRIIDGLSNKQALVLYWYIRTGYPEQKKIATQLKMTRQNVNTHLKRGNSDLIKHFISHFESIVNGETL